jgi:hypothetical protein
MLPLKPNQINEEQAKYLKQQVQKSPAAGVVSEFQSSSKKVLDPYRSDPAYNGNQLQRVGQSLLGQRNSSQ